MFHRSLPRPVAATSRAAMPRARRIFPMTGAAAKQADSSQRKGRRLR
jgi:hypothetical protein